MRLANRFLFPVGLILTGCQTSQPNRFDQADLNSDGQLSRSEVHDHMVTGVFVLRDANQDKTMTTAEWNQPSDQALFNLRDGNGDGMVSLAEAKAYSLKAGTWDATIKEADTSKDGMISRAEATAYYTSKTASKR